MASDKPTFSAGRRWGIFFSVIISIIAVIALVGMLNYLGARYYWRFPLSRQTEVKLSSQTLFFLKSLTNQVKVTIYYDKSDPLYPQVAAWLEEYHLINPKITIQTVDYLRDAGQAAQVKAAYKLGTASDKNLVIFDCNGRSKIIPDAALAEYDFAYKPTPDEKERNFEKVLKTFNGEMRFSPALISVVNKKARKVYFLEGNGERAITAEGNEGLSKFAQVLEQSGVTNEALRLIVSNTIPADCNLLVIAGPTKVIPATQLSQIRRYLAQGGRLFIMFDAFTSHTRTGLEDLLAEWNIAVGMNAIGDPDNTAGGAIVVNQWNRNHPISQALFGSGSSVELVQPRSMTVLNENKTGPETPKVDELASTGPNATVSWTNNVYQKAGGKVPLIVAVEKGSVKGVVQERGTTAIVAVGDSTFLDNMLIEAADNREFARLAVNWLLEQNELLQGVGPHPVTQYKVTMTQAQMSSVRWLLLAIMPGAILAFGGLVWFRRRR